MVNWSPTMSKLKPVDYKTLIKIYEADGFVLARRLGVRPRQRVVPRTDLLSYLDWPLRSAAWAAASRATGTRNGEQET